MKTADASAIRRAVVKDYADVRELLLSHEQYALFLVVRLHGRASTASMVAWYRNAGREVSTASMSGRLRILHAKGYLTRTEHADPTGGHYYEYEAVL